MNALWIVSETGNPRFPYRIEIRRDDEQVIALWVQDKWPGGGKQIFCLREGQDDGSGEYDPAELRELERVRVVKLERFGKQLSVILDRPARKRCNFLFLEKRYRNKPGTYEQIFFRTQTGMQQHRSVSRVSLHRHGAYLVVIDSGERYPWKFGGAPTTRRKLPAGDYALDVDGEVIAVAERKTFENLLTDFATLRVLHGKLEDLSRWRHAAMVIEAQYRDFLDTRKLAGRRPASHVARVLAELHVRHPTVQIIYAGSRKAAAQWCAAWFQGRAKEAWHRKEDERGSVAAEGRGEPPLAYGDRAVTSTADGTAELRRSILEGGALASPFAIQELRELHPYVSDARIRSVLQALRREGRIEREGSGRAARWRRL
ncbi:MAG: ERCC4 domain-containing protein [Spirochaetaceae bacterium]